MPFSPIFGPESHPGQNDLSRKVQAQRISRILVYRCGAIGDTVVALPAINAIRTHYRNAHLILMTATGGDGIVWTDLVLREFGWFDDFVTYESYELRSLRGLVDLLRRVRRYQADLVIYLASDKNSRMKVCRDWLFFRLAGIRRFIPCYSSKVTSWGHLRRGQRVYPLEVHRLVHEIGRYGLRGPTATFGLPIGDGHVRQVSRLLDEGGMDQARPLVGMCPGSKQQAKRWPIERYREVGRRLIEEGGVNIAIVGGSDEAAAGRKISAAWPSGYSVNLAERLTILESAELLRRCLFYVGNDTGAMHLAAAVGTRCVAIFAAREPIKSWFPYGDNHIVLRKDVPCQNCYLSTCVKEEGRCLTGIGVEEVWSACQRMLVYR